MRSAYNCDNGQHLTHGRGNGTNDSDRLLTERSRSAATLDSSVLSARNQRTMGWYAIRGPDRSSQYRRMRHGAGNSSGRRRARRHFETAAESLGNGCVIWLIPQVLGWMLPATRLLLSFPGHRNRSSRLAVQAFHHRLSVSIRRNTDSCDLLDRITVDGSKSEP